MRTSALLLSLLLATSARAEGEPAPAEGEVYESSEGYKAEAEPPRSIVELPPAARAWSAVRGYLSFSGLTGTPFDGARGGGGGWAWGVGFSLAVSYADWPVSIGGDFYHSYFGTLRGTLRDTDRGGSDTGTIVRKRDRVGFADFFVRLQPAKWKARPYIEGVAGFKTVTGQYTVGALLPDDENTTESKSQTARTLGVGTGIELMLSEGKRGRSYVTLSYRWLHGGDVTYDKQVRRGEQVTAVTGMFSTTTSLLMIGLAIELDFGS